MRSQAQGNVYGSSTEAIMSSGNSVYCYGSQNAGISSTSVYESSNTRISSTSVYESPNTGIFSTSVYGSGNAGIMSTSVYASHNTGIPSTPVYESLNTGIPSTSVCGSTTTETPSSYVYGLWSSGIPSRDFSVYGLSNIGNPWSDFMPRRSRTVSVPYVDGTSSEKLISLKRSYSSYKGHLTRIYNELELAMSSSDMHLVEAKRNILEATFDKLVETYNKLMQLMDVHERETFTGGHVHEIQRRNAFLFKYGQWMTTVNNQVLTAVPPVTTTDSTTTTSSSAQSYVNAPTTGIPTYTFAPRSSFEAPTENGRRSHKSRGRKSSTTSSSSRSRVSAKAKLEKARLRLQRLEERKELERKLEEHQLLTEIEEAEIVVRIANEVDSSDEERSDESLGLSIQSYGERMYRFLEECSQQASDQSFAGLPDPPQNRQSTKLISTDVEVDEAKRLENSSANNALVENNGQLSGDVPVNDDQVDDVNPKIKSSEVATNTKDLSYGVTDVQVSSSAYVKEEVKSNVNDVTRVSNKLDNAKEVNDAKASMPTNVNDDDVIYKVPLYDVKGKDDVKFKVNDVTQSKDDVYDQHEDVKPEVKHENTRPKVKYEDVNPEVDVSRVSRNVDVQSARLDEVNDAQVLSNEVTSDVPQDQTDNSQFVDVTSTPTVINVLQKQQEAMDEVVRTLSMPKRGYMQFDGDPLMFPLFIKNFETCRKERNARQRST